ncbi:MAG TPA: cytidylate kinase-like family protein [Pseudonocardia sp.]|jgi:cytidylate kinase|nr:cytidylate kinase-like family protein [Pseudonocardia sp.]
MYVVTLSATFGAGGGTIGPAVAERLDVPFIDRAIPVTVANDLGVTIEDALSRDEQVKGWLSRLLTAAAPLSSDYMIGCDPPRMALLPDTEFVNCTQAAIRKIVSAKGGVLLGRAAAIVLKDHPTALHVRLDGDPDRRIHRAMRTMHLSEADAKDTLVRNDTARANYVRHFYRADPADPGHYHVLLDSTRLSVETCAELIVAAAKASHPVG